MVLYTAQYLRQMLKEKGLPFSKMTTLNLEKAGVIPKPENQLVYRKVVRWGNNTVRVYTEEEMKRIANGVAEYITKRNATYYK